MFYGDFCLQIPGEPFGNLAGKPVLSHFSLEKPVKQKDQQYNAKYNTGRYFPKLTQCEWFL
jgi:hypothetical protein